MELEPGEPNRSELDLEGTEGTGGPGGTGGNGELEPVGTGPGIGKWEPGGGLRPQHPPLAASPPRE